MTLDIEGVLAGHASWAYGGPGVIECVCGWKSERLGPQWNSRKDDRHRAHVAAVLRGQIAEWIAGMPWTETARDDLLAQVAPSRVGGES